jgi:cytochrome oxidase Cu insertion factor (SCO1/SenC/PrrC family)
MPGMNSGVGITDPLVLAAFRSALLHQLVIAVLIFAVLGVAWLTVRALAAARAGGQAGPGGRAALAAAEPAWRLLLRTGFGSLWVFDGILQAQPKMAIGLPSQVIEPIAASSPRWVQHLANWAGTTWSYHPMQAGASVVWIQLGLGIWILAASPGPLSRLAGLASAVWGLLVWVFGEAFGGLFAPGVTWLFGAPGAVLLYCVAGALIALPDRAWYSSRPGRLILAGLGAFLVGMAVLQAWPGRGFWQGSSGRRPGTLAGMTAAMARTPQPGAFSGWVGAFTAFDEAHGFAVNLLAVAALAVIGGIFLTGRRRLAGPAVAAFTVLCLADWVLVEDLGFFGGLGTDPNSMIPFALLAIAGYLALAPAPPVAAPEAVAAGAGTAVAAGPGTAVAAAPAARWRDRLAPASLRNLGLRPVAALGAVGLIILGAAPMAAAQASPNADPILAQAIAGSAVRLNFLATGFRLTDGRGRTVTLAGLRGKVVLLTFLGPGCPADCQVIAQEFRAAARLLGARSRQVELVSIMAGLASVAGLQAFGRRERLGQVPDWLYLTGSPAELRRVWAAYGLAGPVPPGGSVTGNGDAAWVIDRRGQVREELNISPGPGTAASESSFAGLLASAARQFLQS